MGKKSRSNQYVARWSWGIRKILLNIWIWEGGKKGNVINVRLAWLWGMRKQNCPCFNLERHLLLRVSYRFAPPSKKKKKKKEEKRKKIRAIASGLRAAEFKMALGKSGCDVNLANADVAVTKLEFSWNKAKSTDTTNFNAAAKNPRTLFISSCVLLDLVGKMPMRSHDSISA